MSEDPTVVVASQAIASALHSKNEVTTNPTQKFWLFTHPRTASNLLMRILNLNEQPSLHPGRKDYYFLPAMEKKFVDFDGKLLNEWTDKDYDQVKTRYLKCMQGLEKHVQGAQANGKDVFIKEHSNFLVDPVSEVKFVYGNGVTDKVPWMLNLPKYGTSRSEHNKTILPDEFFKEWRPIILIRHPALVFPSLYRTGVDLEDAAWLNRSSTHPAEMTLTWQRHLYEMYTDLYKQDGDDGDNLWPIVIDADDVINNQDVVRRLCEIIGFDVTKLKYQWNVASKEELGKINRVGQRMLSTISASEGVIKEKAPTSITIDGEAKKWKSEFGEEEGSKMERWVRAAMPDYEFLQEKRLRST